MESGFIVLLIMVAVVGIVIGVITERIRGQVKESELSHGVLNVDYSEPENGPYLFLQLVVPIEDVIGRKHVTFDVNVLRDISHK